MKKTVSAIIAFLIVFIISTPVYAANRIIGMDKTDEVLFNDKELIYNYAAKSLPNKINMEINEDMISYDEAAVIYNGNTLFECNSINNKKMSEYINDADICYKIPVKGSNALLIVAKASEVTDEDRKIFSEEDIKYYESIAGRYVVNGIELWNYDFDNLDYVNSLLDENKIDNANVYLVSGVASNLELVAVICSEENEAQFLVLNGWITDSNHINASNPSSKLYSYKEIKKIAVNNNFGEDYSGGSGSYTDNSQYAAIACGVVLALTAAAGVIIAVRKKKQQKTL